MCGERRNILVSVLKRQQRYTLSFSSFFSLYPIILINRVFLNLKSFRINRLDRFSFGLLKWLGAIPSALWRTLPVDIINKYCLDQRDNCFGSQFFSFTFFSFTALQPGQTRLPPFLSSLFLNFIFLLAEKKIASCSLNVKKNLFHLIEDFKEYFWSILW